MARISIEASLSSDNNKKSMTCFPKLSFFSLCARASLSSSSSFRLAASCSCICFISWGVRGAIVTVSSSIGLDTSTFEPAEKLPFRISRSDPIFSPAFSVPTKSSFISCPTRGENGDGSIFFLSRFTGELEGLSFIILLSEILEELPVLIFFAERFRHNTSMSIMNGAIKP
ncbi:MAG: hypothetical protein KKC11_05080 [Candidatus Omnitrophica bacterium]|nr:hypothetical protein [Candidatus Omnitrophota bacterium]MBU1809733.1 hypothetical protein [Candidatus Omnitrophota bacterium]